MPTDLKLTTALSVDNPTEGDLHLGTDVGLSLATGDDEILQRIRAKLRSFRGEWFLDENRGMPWFQDIFGKGRDLQQVNAIIRREVLAVDGVTEIPRYSGVLEGRTLKVVFQVRLSSGAIAPIEEEVP